MTTYKIIRCYYPQTGRPHRTPGISYEEVDDIRGLSLAEARAHCSDPATREEGKWFDVYTEE